MEKAQRDLKGFQRARIELAQQTRELGKAQTKAREYGQTLTEQRERHQNIAAGLRAARAAYKNITTAYQDGKIQGAEYTRQIELARIALLSSEQAHGRSLAAVNKYKAQVRNAEEKVKGFSQSMEGARQRMAGYKERLDAAGVSTERLGAHKRTLKGSMEAANVAIDAQKKKLEALNRVEEMHAKLRDKHGKDMGRLAMRGAMAAGVNMAGQRAGHVLMAPVKAFAHAETAEKQLKIAFMQTDGSVVPEFQQLLGLANQLGDKLPGTTADFIEMMTVLRKEGMSAKAVLGGLGEAAANLGVLLQVGPQEAASRMAKMQDSLRAREDEMLEVADLMQRANYLGADMAFMQSAIGNAAPILDITKTKGAEAMRMLTPFMVMMNQAGMEDGGSVGNAARKIYDRAMNSKKVDKANAVLQDSGAKFKLDFTNGKGEFGGLDNLFVQLAKLRKLTTVQRGMVMNALWGDDAETTRVLSKWIEDNQSGYSETVAKMNAQANLMRRVNEQLDTLENKADAAMGSYSNLLKELGASIEPELKEFVDWLGGLASKLKDWAAENPRVAKTLMLIAAGAAALMVVMGTLGVALVAALGPLAVLRFLSARWAIGLLGAKAGAAGAAAGVGVLARAFGWLKAAWSSLRSPMALFRGLWGVVRGLWRLLTVFARANPLAAIVLGIGGAMAGIYAHWDKIKELWSQGKMWELAKELGAALEWGFNAATGGLYEIIKRLILFAWNKIKSVFGLGGDSQESDEQEQKRQAAARQAGVGQVIANWRGQAQGVAPSVGASPSLAMAPMAASAAAGAALMGPQAGLGTGLQPMMPRAAATPFIATNHITIQAAPGMDEKAMARAISSELDKRDRAMGRNSRSLMRDTD
ncbi:phage tail tape measure protein [Comamonas resistens]|uniref:phage tail tape measure protein n=1 Tax=Comamonas resistens TaxID=3046670 RepID=UPI0039BC47FE